MATTLSARARPTSFLRSSMRLVVAALLMAAPVLAQSSTDGRAALLAAMRDVISGDDRVTSVNFDDPTHRLAIAKALGARVAADGVLHLARKDKPSREASVRVLPAKLRGDSAFVHVLMLTTMYDRPFMSGTMMTLVRRNGGWVVTKYELTGIS
jgi:hypothetical protein